MAKKIEIQGSAITITDTISGLIEVAHPSKDTWYKQEDLDNGRISLYDSNGTTGRGMSSIEFPPIDLSDAVDSSDLSFTAVSFKEFCQNNLGYNAQAQSLSVTALGWEQIIDSQYTSVSPLNITAGSTIILDNNANSRVNTHLPQGVTRLYNSSNSRIEPIKLGDAYLIRVDFTAYNSSPNGLAELQYDIGDGITPIIEVVRSFTFPKGTGAANAGKYSTSTLVPVLSDFIANGCKLQIESITGTTSIYDVKYDISRINVGK